MEEHPEIDYSNVYVLVRIYEVNDDEKIVQDITYATNSQNPVDLRDLKSNDERQILLETASKELGYIYKRKRDANTTMVNSIPVTVAAEAVLSVWRDMPHIARYRKNDLFDSYYDKIFDDLNAAQMVLAVLIFRYCDTMRKKETDDYSIYVFRTFETHFMSNIVGKLLLEQRNLMLENLTHKNFADIQKYFEENKNSIFSKGENLLKRMLQNYFGDENLHKLDGRTIAAPFRRYDLLERYVSNESWWKENT